MWVRLCVRVCYCGTEAAVERNGLFYSRRWTQTGLVETGGLET